MAEGRDKGDEVSVGEEMGEGVELVRLQGLHVIKSIRRVSTTDRTKDTSRQIYLKWVDLGDALLRVQLSRRGVGEGDAPEMRSSPIRLIHAREQTS